MLFLLWLLAGCDDAGPREETIVTVLGDADVAVLHARPDTLAAKYRAMAATPFAFYRGSLPLFAHDYRAGDASATSFPAEAYPLSSGDAHPENFGLLRALDGTLALEPNDFDAADRYPYAWDVRRLVVGLVLAAHASNPSDEGSHDEAVSGSRAIALRAASAYAARVIELSSGADRERIEAGQSPVVESLFSRGRRDLAAHAELDELTIVEHETRTFRRGMLGDDPENVLYDLPGDTAQEIPAALEAYRASLLVAPGRSFFEVLDVARELGAGVASLPRVRVLILVEGPTRGRDDDVVLEMKEIPEPLSPAFPQPGVFFDTAQERVVSAMRALCARPDAEALWGATTFAGIPVQVRLESEAQKSVRVARLEEDEGTVTALLALAETLGRKLADMHASDRDTLRVIAGAIGDDRFAEEQANFAIRYAQRVEEDHVRFRHALETRGDWLGAIPLRSLAPGELQSIFGDAP